MENQPAKKRDNNKIYFLIAVIIALLATNIYFFMQKNKSEEKIVTISDDKTALETELQKLETELEQANNSTTAVSEELKAKDEELKLKIAQLRTALNKGELTAKDLATAKDQIQQLKHFVLKYAADIDQLQQKNAALTGERDSLKTTVSNTKQLANNLSKANDSLNVKVKAGAALKTSGVAIVAVRAKSSGKEVVVTKANTAKKIKVGFMINTNPIAEKGTHDIYMRILDPSGKQILGEGGSFEANNQNLQYTYKTAIEFSGEAKTFTLDWTNNAAFQSGNYSIILYADGYTMGKGTFSLK